MVGRDSSSNQDPEIVCRIYNFKTVPEARFFVDVILFMQTENCPNPATVSEVATPEV